MLKLSNLFESKDPSFKLLRLIFIFLFLDSFYMSLSAAFAFKSYGLTGALMYTTAQYVCSSVGFFSAFKLMQNSSPTIAWRVLQSGLSASSILMAASTFLVPPSHQLAVLALAGAGRGVAWGCRQWLEFNHTKGSVRESYMAYQQAITLAFKVLSPGITAIVLIWFSDDMHYLFRTVGVLCLGWLLFSMKSTPLIAPQVGEIRFISQLKSKDFWKVAPFYCVDGIGTTLRQVLYVTGVIAIVGSVKAFAVLDTVTALIAISFFIVVCAPPLYRIQKNLDIG